MAFNNTTLLEEEQEATSPRSSTPFIILSVISILAILMNTVILACLIRLKGTFRSYGNWFQLVVLSSQDVLNGMASYCRSHVTFKTYHSVCGFVGGWYVFSQINTLWMMGCICVNRFIILKKLGKDTTTPSFIKPEKTVLIVSVFNCVFTIFPFVFWGAKNSEEGYCSETFIFSFNLRQFRIYRLIGFIVPLFIINVLYAICMIILKRSYANVGPFTRNTFAIGAPQSNDCGPPIAKAFRVNTLSTAKFVNGEASCSLTEISSKDKTSNTGVGSSVCDPIQPTKSWNGTYMLPTKSGERKAEIQDQCKNLTSLRIKEPSAVSATHGGFGTRRNAQKRALKLLGIILLLSNLATVIPLAVWLIDLVAPKYKFKSMASGISVSFCLNAFVDAFVYGLCAPEIRRYIQTKLDSLTRSMRSRQ